MKTGPESIETLKLLNALRKAGSKNAVWKRVSELLSRPTRKRSEVSLGKLSKTTKSDETVIIPGKLLSTGKLVHPLTLACFKASKAARVHAVKQGAKIISIQDLLKANPSGTKTRIIV